jgi:hypothetical protein
MLSIEMQIKRFQLTARKHAKLMRDINRRTMQRHAEQRLPNHFEEAAYHLYGARPRDAKYTKAKLKKYGHRKPNVKTGRLKRAVLSRIKITATQYGAKLTTRGSTKSRLQDWQKREIAVISRSEIAMERKRQASEYRRAALSPKYARKRKRRIK